MKRVVMVEISSPNKNQVDRLADLFEDEAKRSSSFFLAAMDHFADDDGRTADDPPVILPTIEVKNVEVTTLGELDATKQRQCRKAAR